METASRSGHDATPVACLSMQIRRKQAASSYAQYGRHSNRCGPPAPKPGLQAAD